MDVADLYLETRRHANAVNTDEWIALEDAGMDPGDVLFDTPVYDKIEKRIVGNRLQHVGIGNDDAEGEAILMEGDAPADTVPAPTDAVHTSTIDPQTGKPVVSLPIPMGAGAEADAEIEQPGIISEFGDFANTVFTTIGDLPDALIRGFFKGGAEAVHAFGLLDDDQIAKVREAAKFSRGLVEKEGVNPIVSGLVEDISAIAAPAIPIFRGLQAVGLARGAAIIIAEGLGDALGTNPDDPALANMLQDMIGEDGEGVLTETLKILATDPNDPEIINRARRFAEGAGIGLAFEGIIKAIQKSPGTIAAMKQRWAEGRSPIPVGGSIEDVSGGPVLPPPQKLAAGGVTPTPGPLPSPRRVGTTGQYIGAPGGVDTPQKLSGLRRKIAALAREGEPGRFWYERSGRQLLEAVGGDIDEADKLIQAIAVTSPGTRVKGNFNFALQAYSQWKAGKPIKTGRFPTSMSKKLEEIFAGKDWAGRKTDDFYNNLMIHIAPERAGPVTGDIWMLRAFGFTKANEMPSPQQYAFMTRETQKIAKQLGWEPHQVQASIWVNMKARSENPDVKAITEKTSEAAGWITYKTNKKGKKERVILDKEKHMGNWLKHSMKYTPTAEDIGRAKFDYADSMRENLAQVSWESIPGRTGNHMPEMFNAPYEQQAEYHVAISKAFLDDGGGDIAAKKLGILTPGDFEAPGYFGGKVSPGTQTEVVAPPRFKGSPTKQLEPASVDLIRAYVAVRGILMKQDGMGWHRPFFNAKVAESNGIEVRIGRSFSEDETARLADLIAEVAEHREYVPISSRGGVRLINFDYLGVDNEAFHGIISRALERMEFDDGADAVAKRFASQNGYEMNDWGASKNGEGYLESSLKGRSDIQRKVRDIVTEIQPRIDDVETDFAERYGWTRNDGLNSGYRSQPGPSKATRKTREEIENQGGALNTNVGDKVGRILDEHGIKWEHHENGGITAIEEWTSKTGKPGSSKKYFGPNTKLGTIRNWLGY